MTGRIIAISYGVYSVKCDGVIYQTSPKGIFRKNRQKLVVGDEVILDDENYVITDLLPRTSLIKRPPISNIEQVFVVFSLSEPSFSYYLALKYLCYCSYNGLKAYLILTKSDKDKLSEGNDIKETFAKIGIETFIVSNKTNEGIEEVKKLFKENTITCFMGQTGVGKSSLINSIDPNYDREVGEYSEALGRGKHKTKEVVLLPYLNGYLADTPGFSSLELDILLEDVAIYYPGFKEAALKCFYNNCLHISEGKCEIKKSVEEGNIPSIIYESYLKLIEEIKGERR